MTTQDGNAGQLGKADNLVPPSQPPSGKVSGIQCWAMGARHSEWAGDNSWSKARVGNNPISTWFLMYFSTHAMQSFGVHGFGFISAILYPSVTQGIPR